MHFGGDIFLNSLNVLKDAILVTGKGDARYKGEARERQV